MDHNTKNRIRRLLITAGPTHEPIDEVRYIGNRSSGRLGAALAACAQKRGWQTTLLIGPATVACPDPQVKTIRFQTTADLERLLKEHLPANDVLVMAAAVADYRPVQKSNERKIRRTADQLTIKLESTPDLLAGCSRARREDQLLVGFALEPAEGLREAARAKLIRKGADLIVANPLETMDADSIAATVLHADGTDWSTNGPIAKNRFGDWLMSIIEPCADARLQARATSGVQAGNSDAHTN